jgi:outer membrane protein OmpA-like peptidoglycan-associated protein
MLSLRNLKVLGLAICAAALAGCAFQAPGPVQCGISGPATAPKATTVGSAEDPCKSACVDSLRRRLDDLERRVGDVAKTADEANATAQKALKCCRKEYEVIMTREIYFDFNKYDIRADAKPILDTVAMKMASDPDYMAELGGNCDGVGTTDYNIVLGQKRADAARGYLISNGRINLGRMQIRTFGKDSPIATNDTDLGRSKNRRVTINILSYAK